MFCSLCILLMFSSGELEVCVKFGVSRSNYEECISCCLSWSVCVLCATLGGPIYGQFVYGKHFVVCLMKHSFASGCVLDVFLCLRHHCANISCSFFSTSVDLCVFVRFRSTVSSFMVCERNSVNIPRTFSLGGDCGGCTIGQRVRSEVCVDPFCD